MQIFFYLFSSFIILGSLGVITSRNPVYSVLWLIFTFLNSAAIFIQLGAEFIAMTVIIVYVGAVAVLFLFVVMMLNIGINEVKNNLLSNRLFSGILMLIMSCDIILIIKSSLDGGYAISKMRSPMTQGVTNAHDIGNILYTNYLIPFQLSGLILLLAMIGCIVLTLRKREGVKKQNLEDQLNRTTEDSIELVKVKLGAGIDGINYN